MFHVYDGKYRVTESPVSYNHIVTYLFQYAKIDWRKLSTLPLGEAYSYNDYKIVRVV